MQKPNAKIPHQNLGYRPVHLTYRLFGSLPVRVLEDIRLKYEERKRQMEVKFKANPELLRSGLYAHEAFVIDARFELYPALSGLGILSQRHFLLCQGEKRRRSLSFGEAF
ncbi:hypothetical protein [Lewinella sp. LCG006]|uniref:hypothetical protein n=1 Tax=Lewinella sp. LCG006 TaxID=3231911 RepID=UPI0034602826